MTKTVLIVDDEPELCEILCYYLADAGYQTIVASGGHEGIRIIERESIDAVISDLRMPNGSGIDLLMAAKLLAHDRPVVLLMTAFSDLSVDEAYAMGAEIVLSKPVKESQLLTGLAKALLSLDEKWQERTAGALPDSLVQLKNQPRIISSSAVSVGRGGAFFSLPVELIPATGDQVLFSVPWHGLKSALLEGKGIVRWCRGTPDGSLPRGVGVEFIELNDECRRMVREYVAALKIKAYIPNMITLGAVN